MTHQELHDRIGPLLADHRVDTAIAQMQELLLAVPKTDYHTVLDVDLDKLNPDFPEWVSEFCGRVGQRMKIGAIYAELNGFTINPDVWFIDMFAFERHGGMEDLDWTADWEKENTTAGRSFAIEGFEKLQEKFTLDLDSTSELSRQENEARVLAEFLVVLRVQQLFQKCVERTAQLTSIPFIVTAHDWDMVYVTTS